MRIAVIGASGRTGAHVMEQGVDLGHRMRAVVRDLDKLSAVLDDDIEDASEVVEADVRDEAALLHALEDVDGVVFCVSTAGDATGRILREGMSSCLAAMGLLGVSRIVAVSASGHTTDGDDPLTRFLAKPVLRRFLGRAFADMRAMEGLLRASDADWTIIRPPRLTNWPEGGYVERSDGNVRWKWMVSRADLAAAVLDAVEDDAKVGATISIAT
jgi:uncharacterized protein YbjT (DUF2867 family)